jgi:hypothetical protein
MEAWATRAIQLSHLAMCHSIEYLALGRMLLSVNRRRREAGIELSWPSVMVIRRPISPEP